MNRLRTFLWLAAVASMMPGCRAPQDGVENNMEPIIEKQPAGPADTLLTPELLWRIGRVGGLQLAPDGRTLLYSVQYYNLEQNNSNKEWYALTVPSGDATLPVPERLTKTAGNEQEASWSPDGQSVYFLSSASGSSQLWRMDKHGGNRQRISDVKDGIETFRVSPDGRMVLYVSTVPCGPSVQERYPDLPQATGRVYNDLMFRHWDEWTASLPHPFVANLGSAGLEDAVDLLAGEPYESPMRPFGGIEQLAWSPDSRCVVYTCRKLQGKDYALSTHSDLYLYDIATKTTRNLTSDGTAETILRPSTPPVRAGRTVTAARNGYAQNPVFSPDGRYIAYESMERDGYESDWNRLMVYDLLENRHLWLATAFDGDVSSLCWADDSRTLYFVSAVAAVEQVFCTHVADGEVRQVTDELCDIHGLVFIPGNISNKSEGAPSSIDSRLESSVKRAEGRLVALRQSMLRPDEVYLIDTATGAMTPLTDENGSLFAGLQMPTVTKRMVRTADGGEMLTWVVLPPHFSPDKTYPALLFCTGGPQGTNGQFWSYRWNLALMASKGYVTVLPNRHGVSGMGQAWKEQISRDYVGLNMQDYLDAIDNVAAEPYVDRNRLGCVGASYGGYSVYWLAGHHDGRFKAFIAHSGIFNAEAQYFETEELWFENWDAGSFWDRQDAAVQRYYEASPHLFSDRWDTPILCIHGEKDFRIAYTQALQAFTAARLRGVEAELLVFPDENHWISKPQNSVLWQRTFFEWLDRWLR
ncbi:MAG: S9 family peptidase [Bacteroidales bacterium]|nr:S9 family peptidase [Bacteroidales bacterium]